MLGRALRGYVEHVQEHTVGPDGHSGGDQIAHVSARDQARQLARELDLLVGAAAQVLAQRREQILLGGDAERARSAVQIREAEPPAVALPHVYGYGCALYVPAEIPLSRSGRRRADAHPYLDGTAVTAVLPGPRGQNRGARRAAAPI